MNLASTVGLHAFYTIAIVQHAHDIGIEIQINTILPRRFQVRIAKPERAYLMIAKELQCPFGLGRYRQLVCTQLLLPQPTYLVSQMWNMRNNMLRIELVFIILNDELKSRTLELEIHPMAVDQFLMQLWIKCIRLQGKVEEAFRENMRC